MPIRTPIQSVLITSWLAMGWTFAATAEPAPEQIVGIESEVASESTTQDPIAAAREIVTVDPDNPSPASEVEAPVQTVANPIGRSDDSDAHEWAPFEIGRRWTYVYVQERSRSLSGATAIIEKLRGTRIDEITQSAPEFGPNVVRMQSRLLGRSDGGEEGLEVREESVRFYRSSGTQYQLVAEEIGRTALGPGRVTRYDSPLQMLESGFEVGEQWSVGTRHQGDLHTKMIGEVLGVQDVQTPAGLFERCLVVRIRGEIAGVVEAYGSRMEVPSGTTTVTVWYAPGVGRVLTKEELSQTMILEDGATLEYSERTQYALRSTEGPAPAAPEPPSDIPEGAQP